jgi:hypothetical protein
MAIPQAFIAAARTIPMSLDDVFAQTVEIPQKGLPIGTAHHFCVGFKESRDSMRSFAEGPRLASFEQNLSKKKIPHGPVEKGRDGPMIRP